VKVLVRCQREPRAHCCVRSHVVCKELVVLVCIFAHCSERISYQVLWDSLLHGDSSLAEVILSKDLGLALEVVAIVLREILDDSVVLMDITQLLEVL